MTISDPGQQDDRSNAELIQKRIRKCAACGAFINPNGGGHTCEEERDEMTYVPDNTRKQREVRAKADNNDPEARVVFQRSANNPRAYHRWIPHTTDPPSTVCHSMAESSSDYDPELLTRRKAIEERDSYPCNRCFPSVAERAVRLWIRTYGERPPARKRRDSL